MAARARRVWRNAERAPRAREGGNHSRVWRSISDPLEGCKESARQDMGDWDRVQLGYLKFLEVQNGNWELNIQFAQHKQKAKLLDLSVVED